MVVDLQIKAVMEVLKKRGLVTKRNADTVQVFKDGQWWAAYTTKYGMANEWKDDKFIVDEVTKAFHEIEFGKEG